MKQRYYLSHKILDYDLVSIRKSKVKLTLNKPTYAGMCNLDFSKILMYKFPYDYVNNKYSTFSRLSFTDTNDVMGEIKTQDFYEGFGKDKEMFDFI